MTAFSNKYKNGCLKLYFYDLTLPVYVVQPNAHEKRFEQRFIVSGSERTYIFVYLNDNGFKKPPITYLSYIAYQSQQRRNYIIFSK